MSTIEDDQRRDEPPLRIAAEPASQRANSRQLMAAQRAVATVVQMATAVQVTTKVEVAAVQAENRMATVTAKSIEQGVQY